jgi:hypothetical protein
MQPVCIALRAVSVEHFPPFHHVAVAAVFLDQLVGVIAALPVALVGALDAEHVERQHLPFAIRSIYPLSGTTDTTTHSPNILDASR